MEDSMRNNTKSRKVLLIYPDFTTTENIKDNYGNYSEGLASISAVLKKGGHQVMLYHITSLPSREQYQETIKNSGADIVAFTVRTTAFSYVKDFAAWTKEVTSVMTLCGGYHPTLDPEEVINAEHVDSICIGEGEFPLLELCDNLDDREAVVQIQNLWFKSENGTIIRNPVRPCVEDLDELPLPDYDLFDFDNLMSSRMKTALVMVSRGCIFSCTYCGNSKLREVYPNKSHYARFRSPQNSIKLLQTILQKFPFIQYLNFRDAILNMKKEWFAEFIELYTKEIHLPFSGNLRLDLLNEDVVRKLSEAGCYMIDVGLESGDYEMRKTYLHRNMTDDQIINSFQWFRKYGITSLTYNIVGLPHEDLKLALKTIKLNAKIRPDRIIANIFTPFPMTQLTEIAREAGYLAENVDFKRRVFLDQPQFPEEQVVFIESYFYHFTKMYQRIWKLPNALSRPAEKLLDYYIVSPHKPHRLFIVLYDFRNKTEKRLKRALLKASPKLYLKLRNARVIRRKSTQV